MSTDTPRPPAESFRRHTVLIVDDEEDIAESLKMIIEDAGDLEVISVTSGDAALHVLEHQPVDLIISDYKMPGMDGLEFLHRAQQVAPGTQRMLITAYPDLDLALRAINDEGVRNVIVKPFEPDMVIDNIFAVLLNLRTSELQARSFARAMYVLQKDRE